MPDFTKAINLDPNDADSYTFRGSTKASLGDYIGSISDYDKAIELKPDNARAYFGRGTTKIQLDQKYSGCLDLSKAGEQGIAKAYEGINLFCN